MSALLKNIIIIISIIIIKIILPTPTFAQTTAAPNFIPATSPAFTDLILQNTFHSFSCLAIGQSLISQPCLSYQKGIPVLSLVDSSGGILGTTGNLITALIITPPIKASDYIASLGEGLGVAKVAHAQGVAGSGDGVLRPILTLWQVSRNIAYLAMIIIFVIIGFMIMFRQKINPQTVITAQTALPGLVIGLVMITFSYFLASLITDVAFVGTNLVGYYFSAAQNQPPQNLVQETAKYNVLSIYSKFTGIIRQEDLADILGGIWDYLDGSVQFVLRMAAFVLVFQQASQLGALVPVPQWSALISAGIGAAAGALAAQNPAGTVALALSIIAIFILIYQMMRLLLKLINNYLQIIFLVITAPFHFLVASLPGRQGIATAWVLNMLCNVLVFPAVIAVFYFVNFLLGSLQNQRGGIGVAGVTGQINPFINTPADWPFHVGSAPTSLTGGAATLPLFGGLDLGFVNILIAFGALVALPSIPDLICKTIGRATQAGQMIGQEVGAGIGAGRGYAGQFQGGVTQTAGGLGKGIGGEKQVMYAGVDEKGNPIYRAVPTGYGLTSVPGAIKRANTPPKEPPVTRG